MTPPLIPPDPHSWDEQPAEPLPFVVVRDVAVCYVPGLCTENEAAEMLLAHIERFGAQAAAVRNGRSDR